MTKTGTHRFGSLAIAAGFALAAAVRATAGNVVGWGNNEYGQADAPPDATNVIAVAGGGGWDGTGHSMALRDDGTVLAWGGNNSGQSTVPDGLTNVIAIAAGWGHSLALRAEGTLVAWGYNGTGQCTVPDGLTNVVAIAAGGDHSLALRSDTTVVAWGYNYYGQSAVPENLTNVVAIAGGSDHSLALRADGTVVGWGANWSGQSTGVPNTVYPYGSTGTVAVAGQTLRNVVALAAGEGHSLALRADGTVVAWGGGVTVPAGLSNVVAIAAGYGHSLALRADGTVVAWGDNYYGQSAVPMGLSNVVAVATGCYHSLAVGSFAPVITVQPLNRVAPEGGAVTFTAEGVGLEPLSYQWQLNGTNVGGATSDSLRLTNVRLEQAGSYVLVVTNAYGVAASSNAVLEVTPPSPCTIQPAGLVAWWPGEGNADDMAGTNNGVLEGGVVFGDGEVGEAFSFDGVSGFISNAVPGLTNIHNSYTMEFWAWPNASRASTGEFIGFGYAGRYGQRFAICPADSGASERASVGVSVGTNGVSVIEGGASVLVYDVPILGWTHFAVVYRNQQPQLYVNGVLVRVGLVSGADSYPSTWLGGRSESYWSGYYAGLLDEVSIYNRALSASEIQAVYTAGTGGKCRASAMSSPIITLQPDRYRAVLEGWTNTFIVEAVGDPPLSYQWHRNGVIIPGATGASLTLTNVRQTDAGTYNVEVSNSYGPTNSTPAVLAVVFPNSSPVKYVNVSNATPTAPFSTWATAAIHIQDAILFANDADTVLVRGGVYNENIDFLGKAIVVASEDGPGGTVIDGNRSGSVVTFSGGEGTNTVIKGFTITDGYAAQGGGIYCTSASPVVTNCIIVGNTTLRGTNAPGYPDGGNGGNGGDGAGVYASATSVPMIIGCVISNNVTGTGGLGEWGYQSPASNGSGGNGGGVFCYSATIANSLIVDNSTGAGCTASWIPAGNGGNGGGIFCGSAVVLDSVIQNNATGQGGHVGGDSDGAGSGGKGGGIYSSASTVVERCTIIGNRTGDGGICNYTSGDGGDGGGVYAAGGLPRFGSCAFLDNSTGNGGARDHSGGNGGNGAGLCAGSNCLPVVSSCHFVTNRTGGGGWASCEWGIHAVAGGGGKGGGVFCSGGTFSHCTLQANTTGNGGVGEDLYWGGDAEGGAGGDGAGMYANGPVSIRSCLFLNNATGQGGDGMYGVSGNGGSGGGIWNQDGTVANCTTWGNSLGAGGVTTPSTNAPGLSGVGGGIWSSNGVVLNCILWNDGESELAGSGFQVAYSDIRGGTGQPWFDPGNCLDVEPQFVNPELGDWHLACLSPCINAGTNEAWMAGALDLDGNPRIRCELADMGAFEVQNDGPLAADLAAATRQDLPLTLATEILLARASDPDADALTVSAVSPASANGGVVVLSGGAVVYTPPGGFVGADRFSYTVSDGCGGRATASVWVSVLTGNDQSQNMLPPLYTPDGLVVRFAGIVGRTYSVQRALAVTGPWETIGTATVGVTGIGTFLDPNPPAGSAFYRTTYP